MTERKIENTKITLLQDNYKRSNKREDVRKYMKQKFTQNEKSKNIIKSYPQWKKPKFIQDIKIPDMKFTTLKQFFYKSFIYHITAKQSSFLSQTDHHQLWMNNHRSIIAVNSDTQLTVFSHSSYLFISGITTRVNGFNIVNCRILAKNQSS